ncbi:hypothetical protein [Aureibacter tunicatorum]|uniref:Uncharacterized protein n=1 Tax=Aureibacter tunicatorum TaxID=866807 RepID=A0AAE4BRQ4_9BACT|nr:hypothetical protein [Aureibacter tunicatorum]MDR6237462.1 hypothetical protein [Aureibacter tunicatorum]BDD06451.1 hypothetical protein AUTU_39340 [Aureibacter tunicatorum]
MYKINLIILTLLLITFSCETKQKHVFEKAVYIENDTIPIRTELDTVGIIGNSAGLVLDQVIEDDVFINNIDINNGYMAITYKGCASSIVNQNKRLKAHNGLVIYRKNIHNNWIYEESFIINYINKDKNKYAGYSIKIDYPYLYLVEVNKSSNKKDMPFERNIYFFKYDNNQWKHTNKSTLFNEKSTTKKLAYKPSIKLQGSKMFLFENRNTLNVFEIQHNQSSTAINLLDSISFKANTPNNISYSNFEKLIFNNDKLISIVSYHSHNKKKKKNSFKYYQPKVYQANLYEYDKSNNKYFLNKEEVSVFDNESNGYNSFINLSNNKYIDIIDNDSILKYSLYSVNYSNGINNTKLDSKYSINDFQILPIDSITYLYYIKNNSIDYINNVNTDSISYSISKNSNQNTQIAKKYENQFIIYKLYRQLEKQKEIESFDLDNLYNDIIENQYQRKYRSKIFFLNTDK